MCTDYQKYLGMQEHFSREFQQCMDSTWISDLKRLCGGFVNVTVKQFFHHLHANVSKMSTKERREAKKEIEIKWDQNKDILEFLEQMENAQMKLEHWGIPVEMTEMVDTALSKCKTLAFSIASFSMNGKRRQNMTKHGRT